MKPMLTLHPQYVTNEYGEKKAVILPLEEYEELLEDLNDLAVIAERQKEETISHSHVVKDLKKNGYL